MKDVPVKLGPLALLLTVISICLTTLAILTFATSRADLVLAEKYAETVRSRYELEQKGQEFRCKVLSGQEIAGSRDFEEDGMHLFVSVEEDGTVREWRFEKEWSQDLSIGNLWGGR